MAALADDVYSTQAEVNGADWTSLSGGIVMRFTQGVYDGLNPRGVDYTIPGVEGQVPFPRYADTVDIVGEGFVIGNGSTEADQREDFRDNRATVFAAMRGDQDPYTLVHIEEDGTRLTCQARPLRVEWGPDTIPSYREFTAFWTNVGDSSTGTAVGWTEETP